jgi:hypothetical protein
MSSKLFQLPTTVRGMIEFQSSWLAACLLLQCRLARPKGVWMYLRSLKGGI